MRSESMDLGNSWLREGRPARTSAVNVMRSHQITKKREEARLGLRPPRRDTGDAAAVNRQKERKKTESERWDVGTWSTWSAVINLTSRARQGAKKRTQRAQFLYDPVFVPVHASPVPSVVRGSPL